MTAPNGDATVDLPSLDSDIEILPLGDADLERTLVILLARLTSVGGRKDDVSGDSSLVGDLVFRTVILGGEVRVGGFWTESPSFGDVWDIYQARTLGVWLGTLSGEDVISR